MRVIAFIALLIATAAVGFGGYTLWLALDAPVPPAVSGPRSAPEQAPDANVPPQVARRWPSVFGEAIVEEPQPPTPPTPPVQVAPPQPPAPPIDALGFALQGMVRNGTGDWAIVTHPTGDVILRVGDTLVEGVTVVEIAAEGVWVLRDGTRSLLGFSER